MFEAVGPIPLTTRIVAFRILVPELYGAGDLGLQHCSTKRRLCRRRLAHSHPVVLETEELFAETIVVLLVPLSTEERLDGFPTGEEIVPVTPERVGGVCRRHELGVASISQASAGRSRRETGAGTKSKPQSRSRSTRRPTQTDSLHLSCAALTFLPCSADVHED